MNKAFFFHQMFVDLANTECQVILMHHLTCRSHICSEHGHGSGQVRVQTAVSLVQGHIQVEDVVRHSGLIGLS